jgi:hypothetical protein
MSKQSNGKGINMITVRFPSGFSVQYNDAKYSFREAGQTLLYESSAKQKLFAIVPNEALIEHAPCCTTYNAPATDLEAEVRFLRKKIESLTRKIGK